MATFANLCGRIVIVIVAASAVAGCGMREQAKDLLGFRRSHLHRIKVDNQSSDTVKFDFDANQPSDCEDGYQSREVNPKSSEIVDVIFSGCVGGAGKSIDLIGYRFIDYRGNFLQNTDGRKGVLGMGRRRGARIVCRDVDGCEIF